MDPQRLLDALSRWTAPATVVLALAVGLSLGLGPALLVLAGGVLLGVVLLLWSSLGRLTGESPLTLEEAIGLGAPSAEEERKRAILRALKDLEFERSVGKISDEDYAELSTRYRSDAKALLRVIEETTAPARKKAEERLAERLKAEGAIAPTKGKRQSKRPKAAREQKPEAAASDSGAEGARNADGPVAASDGDTTPPSTEPVCAACSTSNDADARFCKRCGATLVAAEEAS